MYISISFFFLSKLRNFMTKFLKVSRSRGPIYPYAKLKKSAEHLVLLDVGIFGDAVLF